MFNNEKIFNLLPQLVHVPTGVTLGVFVQGATWQVSYDVQNGGGGTLWILPANNGSTYAAATLAAVFATFAYNVIQGAPVEINGPANFYLAATGATAVAMLLRKQSVY